MEIFLIKTLQFILAISLLVLLHEGGHFFFSKLFGVRVNKFYIFFDWKFSIFKWKPKNSDTEYGIGWIPLGGYCQIEGMIDETQHDAEKLANTPAQPWEFRSKPCWQRLLIMIGGVLVNFVLAIFIYSMVLFTWGDSYISTKDMTMGMKFNSEAKALGFKDGDIVIGTENGDAKEFGADLFRDLSSAKECRIIRDGKPMTIKLPGDINLLGMLKTDPMFMRPFIPSVIDSVMPGTEAARLKLVKGDRITSVNKDSIDCWSTFNTCMNKLAERLDGVKTIDDSLKIRTIDLTVMHENGARDTLKATLDYELKLGVTMTAPATYYKTTTIEYGFLESFPAGIAYGCNILSGYVSDLKYVFTADGAKSLGGFGTIGSLFPPVWDWHMFWLMTAFLSIILAFMNILPIPALDGGHVLFLLYEMITRRKPSDKFMIRAEYIGMGILLLLMVLANLNDVLRWLGLM